jgi:phosphinothricin acetyltransferase
VLRLARAATDKEGHSLSRAPIRVREVTPGDLGAVAEIYAHYVAHSVATFEETPPDEPAWRVRAADLAARGLPFVVAEAAGEVVGYAYAAPWRPKPAYRFSVEDTIYLAPDWTGRGVGRSLLGAVLAGAAAAGARQMIAVIADTGSPSSAALHKSFGFTEAGLLRNVGYKHDRWVDTLLMQRDLTT